jgi:hypothetical protein
MARFTKSLISNLPVPVKWDWFVTLDRLTYCCFVIEDIVGRVVDVTGWARGGLGKLSAET